MGNILSRPSRSLTTSGSRVITDYCSDLTVELAPAYLDASDWRDHIDKARASDGRDFIIKIHPDVKISPCQRTVFWTLSDINTVLSGSLNLSYLSPAIAVPSGAGLFPLSLKAINNGLRVVDANAVLAAHLNRPFGFPSMSRKQAENLSDDQAILFNSLALANKVGAGNVLFLTNRTRGLALRAWHSFARSYAIPRVVTFLVVTPPDVVYVRAVADFQQRCSADPAYEKDHGLPSHRHIVEEYDSALKDCKHGLDFDFLVEVPDRGDATLSLDNVISVVRLSKGTDI